MPSIKRNQVPANLWQSIKPNQSVRHFENAVIQFHYLHKTPIRQLPYVLGKKINLRKLYISVIKKGGYKKVNEKEAWDDVLCDLNLPKEATNSELAIQTIYHRYLEDYERNQWNSLNSGSIIDCSADNNQLDIDFSKHSTFISELAIRDRSCLAAFVYDNTPKIYSDYRHIISNTSRSESGLSCDLKEATELKHLIMSLKSGLCNEIDFALNSLLIISNNDRIPLDLRFTGELLDLIIAMVGMVDIRPGSYYDQFKNYDWMKDCLKFWNRIVEDGVGRMFLVPNIFTCSKTDMKHIQRNHNISASSGFSELFNDDNHYHKISDPCCQRVHLVATIIHNLAHKSVYNSQALVNNNQTLRFLLLAVHCRDSVLRRLSLHTLTKLRFVLYPIQDCPENVLKTLLYTPDIIVDIDDNSNDKDDDSDEEWFTEFLLDFLMSLLSSENRCDRISAFEMVQSLCFIEDNHETLSKHLQNQFIVRISSQLLVPDIHPLCGALEALVALSQLGDDMCRRMAMCKSLLKCLLQFVNIEAQMFGPTAVYKIKTFNGRPPIPAANYHSLRMPVQSSFRSLAPFTHPTSPFIPNNSHNLSIRSPAIASHSIAPYSLSKPNVNLQMQSPQIVYSSSPSQYINTNHVPVTSKTQLSPFQEIDHLLTKTIASFSSPLPSHPTPIPQSSENANENVQQTTKDDSSDDDADVSYVKIENSDDKSPKEKHERRIVKIKCCVEGVDLEIGEINGANKPLVNGTSIDVSDMNGDDIPDTKTELDKLIDSDPCEFFPDDKDQQYLHQNGTMDQDESGDEDPDRRQMPPPSLPTPSMLKKQMRPKSTGPTSQIPAMTNGFLPQPQTQQQLQLQSLDDRCEQVKSWLKKNFQVTDDVKLFVAKHQLVEEMNEALFEDDDQLDTSEPGNPKMALSAQELHNCVKEIFGATVQVKVEQGVNGASQLIYSHLGRLDCTDIHKSSVTNGMVIHEMNGFVNHAQKRKAVNGESDDDTDEKKLCESDDQESQDEKLKEESVAKMPARKKPKSSRRRKPLTLASKVKQKYRHCKDKHQKVDKPSPPPTVAILNGTDTVTQRADIQTPITNQGPYLYCLWGNCLQCYVDQASLQTHITNDHLDTISSQSSPLSSPTRVPCQWRECPSGQILRAPLSLLSHVIQEHCTPVLYQPGLAMSSPNTRPTINTNYNVVTASPSSSINHQSPALNTMVSSNMKSTGIGGCTSNQMLEKSGWSVLYDHYRLDEQLQSNLPEGPITKHIRISSSIILRNMSRHSIIAKEFLRSNEKYLAMVAMNNQDCSSIIVQCLDELSHQASSTPTIESTNDS